MGQVDISGVFREGIFQNDTRMEMNIRQERLSGQMGIVSAAVRIGRVAADGITSILLYNIMVAIEHVQSSAGMKAGEKGEDISVAFYDLLHTAVFPQLIPVPQFNVGIACSVVMLQGRGVQILIFEEIIVGSPDAPVTVADQDIFGAVIQREPWGSLKRFVQTGIIAHETYHPYILQHRLFGGRCFLNLLSRSRRLQAKGR